MSLQHLDCNGKLRRGRKKKEIEGREEGGQRKDECEQQYPHI